MGMAGVFVMICELFLVRVNNNVFLSRYQPPKVFPPARARDSRERLLCVLKQEQNAMIYFAGRAVARLLWTSNAKISHYRTVVPSNYRV